MKSTSGGRPVQRRPGAMHQLRGQQPGLEHISCILGRMIMVGRSGRSWASLPSEPTGRVERQADSAPRRRPA